MLDPPAGLALNWPEPNYDNPETRESSIRIVASICIPIIVLTFVSRMYSRIYVARFFGLDDWLIVPSVIFGLGYSSVMLIAINHGWYKHVWDVPIPTLINARKLILAADLTGLLNVGFTKLSVLALYLRLAPPSSFRITVYTIMAITTAWMISLTVTTFLMCIPLHAYWDYQYTGKQTCLAEVPYFVAFSSVDLVLDTIIYILPLPVLVQLKLPKRQKLILIGVFGLGILVIASAALRLPSLLRVSESYDLTWEIYDSAIWTETEAVLGVFCASVPALKPLVQRHAPVILGWLGSGRQQSEEFVAEPIRDDQERRFKSKSGSDVELMENELTFLNDDDASFDQRRRPSVQSQ